MAISTDSQKINEAITFLVNNVEILTKQINKQNENYTNEDDLLRKLIKRSNIYDETIENLERSIKKLETEDDQQNHQLTAHLVPPGLRQTVDKVPRTMQLGVGKRGDPTLNAAIGERPKTSRLFVTDIVILSPSRDKNGKKYGKRLSKNKGSIYLFSQYRCNINKTN
ncbi:hypothetical protein K0M31_011177 [Melipona bicolor]|uniref:Uncharacterized protein n=1 Tax=Melipona bicolor TaxID=60889 RepID=A0AA40GA90_9HYME|nr:hypothetical protein K0M31_011177 [Melipona bicolor]